MPGVGATRSRTPSASRPHLAAPVGGRPGWVIGAACVAAVTSCLAALVLGGGIPDAVADGLPDPGALTHWGLPLVGLLTNLAAVGTIGSLLVGTVLLRAGRNGELSELAHTAVTRARHWAAAWALLTAGELLLTVSDIAAVPLSGLDTDALASVLASSQGKALGSTVLVAAVVAATAGRTSTAARGRVLLVVALVGRAVHRCHGPRLLRRRPRRRGFCTGGARGGRDPVDGEGSPASALHLRLSPSVLAAAVSRFSALALAAYVAPPALACSPS